MILTKILRAADHPYLMGKGGRMVIQITIIKIIRKNMMVMMVTNKMVTKRTLLCSQTMT